MSFLNKKISTIELDSNVVSKVLLNETDTDYIEHALVSFESLNVLALSVDEYKNIFISLPWHDGCTYYFLRFTKNRILDDIKLQNYKMFEGNWYLDKECASEW